MAWGFDSLDQRVFSLTRIPALVSLMDQPSDSILVQEYAKIATATFLLGWGIGGLSFGAIGDRFGRVRVLALSIFGYALCTGLARAHFITNGIGRQASEGYEQTLVY